MVMYRETELLEQIETLKGQVAYWRGEAEQKVAADTRLHLAESFGLTSAESWIVAALYGRRGKVVSRDFLADEAPGHAEYRSYGTIAVLMTRARKAMGSEAIETVRGEGYRLTETGIALCDAALTTSVERGYS